MTSSFALTARARLLLAALIVASLCAALLVVAPPEARAATTYYVDNTNPASRNVKATDGGGTSARPFATLRWAIPQLDPGDTLIVRGGPARNPYREAVGVGKTGIPGRGKWYHPATAAAPIVVRADRGHRPWISGVLHVRGSDHWKFRGINVKYSSATASSAKKGLVKFMDGVGWEFRGGRIAGARGYAGLFIGDGPAAGPRSWNVSGNCLARNSGAHVSQGQAHNLYIAAGLNNRAGTVARNIIFGAPKGFNVKVGVGGNWSNGTSGVSLVRNTLYAGASNIVVTGKSNNVTMVRNLMGRTGALVTGKSGTAWYPVIRPFRLSGGRNVAKYNYGFESKNFIKGIRGDGKIRSVSNVLRRKPRFNNTKSCTGFKPRPKMAYGRYS